MRGKGKFIVGSLAILVIVGYLILSGMRETTVYFLTVSELLAEGQSIYNTGVRVNGKVVAGSVKWNANTLELNFQLTDGKTSIPVVHRGVAPDLFQEGREVVVEGKWGSDQIFRATHLLTKCPSKYETR
ncbi:MAG: cytochrome c maturation protein CcmE [candidate division KSB1 bacterium]|nr:cytochrome c maturation protein CcmE [candidate division KSB1 bacterium]